MPTDSAPLDVGDLSYSYGRFQALNSVSFTVERGDFAILLGPNGAGKTTLFSLLTGLYHTWLGRIVICGYDVSKQSSKALHQIGVVFQQRSLDMDLTAWQNIRYSASLYGLPVTVAKKRTQREMKRFDMCDHLHAKIRHLSGGQVRRIEIVRALIQSPRLLILDEPTVGLDVHSRNMIIEHVRSLCANGLSVLWTTHLFDEVKPDDRVLILRQGKLVRLGRAGEIAGTTDPDNIKAHLSTLL